MALPYPLLFEPLLFEKVWGGRALERLGKQLPPGKMIGESWELADMPVTSASGAGGGAARSVIRNGILVGKTLTDAGEAWGSGLMGDAEPADGAGGFPLLIKFLDARENLSVQVHPSPAYAEAHPQARLKTECWYILHAEPGALIYKGIKPGVTREALAAHIADGTVAADLIAVPAVAGDCHNLPSGTCHALGAGVLVAEVQTPSDTTFRVFDWGRAGRQLHIREALQCIELGPAPPATRLGFGAHTARLVTSEFFTLDEHHLNAGECLRLGKNGHAVALIVLSGSGEVRTMIGAVDLAHVDVGQTCLVPAACAKAGAEYCARTPGVVLCAALAK